MILVELELTPKDSDFVGGAISPCTYVTAAKAQRKFGLFGVTSATVRTFLLGAALYTTAHYKDTACMTSSRTAVAKQTSSFLVVRERCLHARCLHYVPRGPPGSSALCTIVVSTILCYSVDGYTLGVCDIVAVYSQLPGCYTVPHPSYIRSSQWC